MIVHYFVQFSTSKLEKKNGMSIRQLYSQQLTIRYHKRAFPMKNDVSHSPCALLSQFLTPVLKNNIKLIDVFTITEF